MRFWMKENDLSSLLERYRKLIELSLDLASTLDLNELLNRIVNAAADLCHAEAASILLYDEINKQLYFQAATNLDTPMMRGLVVPVSSSIAGWIVLNLLDLDEELGAGRHDVAEGVADPVPG